MIDARNARREAQVVVGDDADARVLEPSPPAVDEAPWFADDPVDPGPGDHTRPIVSPVATGDRRWTEWLRDHPEHRAWAAERWLGAYRRLGPPPPRFATTRRSLHLLAAYVVSPARRRATTKIGLRWTLGGFGTPFFGDDEQVRVAGTSLVVQRRDTARATPISSLTSMAGLAGVGVPDVDWASRFDVPAAGDVDAPLDVDAAGAAWLGDWFGFATAVLETVRADTASFEASRLQLWPEHFDVAFECLSETEHRRAGYGVSPGDDDHDEPYVYVTLWSPEHVTASPLWNATHFAGAVLPVSDLLEVDDQVGTAASFLRSRRDELVGE